MIRVGDAILWVLEKALVAIAFVALAGFIWEAFHKNASDAAQKSLQPSPDALHCDCRSATQRPRNEIIQSCPGGTQ